MKEHGALNMCENCYQRYWRSKNKDKTRATWRRYKARNYNRLKKMRKGYYENNIGGKMNIRHIRHCDYYGYAGGKLVHIAIAEKVLGRKLKKQENVHHLDGNGLNNEHSNLVICSRAYHAWLHKVGRAPTRPSGRQSEYPEGVEP